MGMSDAFDTECSKTGAYVNIGVELRNVLM